MCRPLTRHGTVEGLGPDACWFFGTPLEGSQEAIPEKRNRDVLMKVIEPTKDRQVISWHWRFLAVLSERRGRCPLGVFGCDRNKCWPIQGPWSLAMDKLKAQFVPVCHAP